MRGQAASARKATGGKRMSRKSGNRFSEKDMRKRTNPRAHHNWNQSGCALGKLYVFLYKANRGIGARIGAHGGRVVRFENVGLRYGLGPEVLRDLTFRIEPHSFQFLTGPSGAGKTSLLRLLFLSMRPTRGLVSLFGHDLATLTKDSVAALRRRI